MSSLEEYLEKKYGATPSTSNELKKKKKKKQKPISITKGQSSGNYAIIDDDDLTNSWKSVKPEDEWNDSFPSWKSVNPEDEEEDEGESEIKKTSKWKPIQGEDEDNENTSNRKPIKSEIEEKTPADKKSASGVTQLFMKRNRHRLVVLVDTHKLTNLLELDASTSKPTMASGLPAGLLSADQVQEMLDKRKRKREEDNKGYETGANAEIVHRDKYGRKIDMNAKREAERKKIEEEEKRAKWGNEDKKQKERTMKDKPLAIYKDDAELNEELKARERWNDPAAIFLPKTKKIKDRNIPKYQGTAPPNRFGIQPGYRWDGVDRSNGFEREHFARQNTRKALEVEAYRWSVEDM
ncbi:10968_t:CDS:2 [Paraglomus occultum]|uniref:10968_t:CDS:1 n=1 Tax=Paraglomus occultum TaxID=144539 RepID=A0A9N9A3H9_9GLOM|nr:10968_t:CDS:2 [Paraglomus occultum]